MPKRVEVYRSGGALWVVVDGEPLPADWFDDVSVHVDAEDDDGTLLLTMRAERIVVDAGPVQVDAGEESDAEADRSAAPETAGVSVRVPV